MARIALQVLFMFLGFVGEAAAAPVMTPLDPARHGFRFSNTFQNDAVPALDIGPTGCAGGARNGEFFRWELEPSRAAASPS